MTHDDDLTPDEYEAAWSEIAYTLFWRATRYVFVALGLGAFASWLATHEIVFLVAWSAVFVGTCALLCFALMAYAMTRVRESRQSRNYHNIGPSLYAEQYRKPWKHR